MHKPVNPNIWNGRNDHEDGELKTRVHHKVNLNKSEVQDTINIVGFETDAGVLRNKGRKGAKRSPDLIRKALANLAWHKEANFTDKGNIECEGDKLEKSQQLCADVISQSLNDGSTIVLGGGHEIAYASFCGLASYLQSKNANSTSNHHPKIGIINFDAHFDLRAFEHDEIESIKPSSGTPFNQIHQYCQAQGWEFLYQCIGVSHTSNTPALFKTANDLNVKFIVDKELTANNETQHIKQLNEFIDYCDYIYLTIDLDVFPAFQAPGVSAPAAKGVTLERLTPFLETIYQSNEKLLIADIAELNPNFDIDGHTARLAARLCWEIAEAMADSQRKK